MTFKTFIRKVFHLFEQQIFLSKYKVNDYMYFIGNKLVIKKYKTIIMYFPDYEFMHYGDHLFFEPLARVLDNNFIFKIYPIKDMEFYFKELGYSIAADKDLDDCDLIITRKEFYSNLKNKKNVLYINLASLKIANHICDDLVEKVSNIFKIQKRPSNLKPQILKKPAKHFNFLDTKQKYVIYNNYIDSASYRLTKKNNTKLKDYCREFALKNNVKVIHVGSQEDKNNDKNYYDFIDIDLRGKTSIKDLFILASKKNIVNCICYDSFVMHLFSIYNKKSFVIFRGRFTKMGQNVIINNFNPPFKSCNDLIEMI